MSGHEYSAANAEGAPDGATVSRPEGSWPPVGAPAHEPRAGVATDFELIEEIGRGGMGVVYRARDRALDREVAVKILQEKYAPDSGTAARFVDEARITGQLQHPGIPAVYRVGTWTDGRPFLAMKLIKGRTLDDALKADGPHPIRWLSAFEHICQALGYAHARGVIHRDLKPQNVMAGAFGEVQVMDWGLAKVLAVPERERPAPANEQPAVSEIRSLRESDGSVTQAGSVLGTPAFMPPEQAAGEIDKIDCRSDVFGLGAILCALLTGRPPYSGRDAQEMRVKAVRGATEEAFARLDGCGAEPDVVALCKRCLAFALSDRPADANVLVARLAELRTAADERTRQAERDRHAAEVRAAEQARRRRALMGSAVAVIAVLSAGVVASLLQTKRARDAESATAAQLDKTQLAEEAARTKAEELDATLRLISYVGVRNEGKEKAVDFYTKLLKIRQRVVNENPDDLEARVDLANAHRELGMAHQRVEQPGPAGEAFNKACEMRQALVAAKPDNKEYQHELAACYQDLASAFWTRGEHAIALANQARALAVYDRLIATSSDVRWYLDRRGWLRSQMGQLLRESGNPKEAREVLRAAVSDWVRLRAQDPAAVGDSLARAHRDIGTVTRELGELKAAQESFRLAINDLEREIITRLGRAPFEPLLAECYELFAGVSAQLDDADLAVRGYRELVAGRRRILDTNPKDADARGALVKALELLGGAAVAAHDDRLAVECYERALEGVAGLDHVEDRGIDVEALKSNLAISRARLVPTPRPGLAPPPRFKPEK
ncbi:protein kinase [Gemmata sp. JC717]|uniref:protein kinase domain-containing protein n=1 Tax=Gemmata algarum TaxID=2975278 RepID=UPI0021BAC2C8|nr:protein kinase [Gemmata algarum]MDY3553049.1 protein kinase [Gemmata algarum]